MNKSKAIKQYCLDCSGGTKKEVTLCHIVNCPLWPFRFGYSVKDKRFIKRMEAAKRKYPQEYQEMLELISDYQKCHENRCFWAENEQINAVLKKKVTE